MATTWCRQAVVSRFVRTNSESSEASIRGRLKSGAQLALDARGLTRYRNAPDLIRARPVQVDPEGFIYDGHHRCRVAAEIGCPIDVEVIDVPPGGHGVPVLDMPVR